MSAADPSQHNKEPVTNEPEVNEAANEEGGEI